MTGPCAVSGRHARNKAPSASKAFAKISSFIQKNLNTDLACPLNQHGSGSCLGLKGDKCFQPYLPEKSAVPWDRACWCLERNLPLDFSVWDIHVARKFQVTKFQERRQSSKAHYLNLFLFSISMWQSSICISVTDFRESYSEVWIKYKISLFPLDSTTQLCVISVKDTSP